MRELHFYISMKNRASCIQSYPTFVNFQDCSTVLYTFLKRFLYFAIMALTDELFKKCYPLHRCKMATIGLC